jgi:hypothetical protein
MEKDINQNPSINQPLKFNPIEEPFREAKGQFIEVASVISRAKFLIIASAVISMVIYLLDSS